MPKKVYSQSEKNLVQQPLNQDGWSDDRFSELYGKDKNPHLGSERDRKNKKWRLNALLNTDQKKYEKGWLRIFGKKNEHNERTIKGTEKSELGK